MLINENIVSNFITFLNPSEAKPHELRIIDPNGHGGAGFYTNIDLLVKCILIHKNAQLITIGINPRSSNVLTNRAMNTFYRGGKGGKDCDVLETMFFFIDFDTVRPEKNISSTHEELMSALPPYEATLTELRSKGITFLLRAHSGNGRHILIPTIPYKNTKENATRARMLLKYFSKKYDSPHVKIDQGVFDPSRVIKAYGTPARKGFNSELRPHRISQFEIEGNSIDRCDLYSIYAQEISDENAQSPIQTFDDKNRTDKIPIKTIVEKLKGLKLYEYPTSDFKHAIVCPNVESHTTGKDGDTSTVIIGDSAGNFLGFKCLHSHCTNYKTQDFLNLLKINNDNFYNWPEVKPLPTSTRAAPDMPMDLVPNPIKKWATDTSTRMGVPIQFIVVPFVSSIAIAIGRKYAVQPKKNDSEWIVFASVLWCVIVANAGKKKSPALAASLAALNELSKEYRIEFQNKDKKTQHSRKILEIKIKAQEERLRSAFKTDDQKDVKVIEQILLDAKKELAAITPHLTRLTVEDTTIEKLGELLRDNPKGLGIVVDELTGWLRGLERTGHECSRAFYLKAWGGNTSDSVDRIGRGTIIVEALYLVIIGGIQPSLLKRELLKILRGDISDDGLIQRFQLAILNESEHQHSYLDISPDLFAKDEIFRLFKRIQQSSRSADRKNKSKPWILNFSKAAQETNDAFMSYHANLFKKNDMPPALESHFYKYSSTMPALALIFYLLDFHSNMNFEDIQKQHVVLAVKWVEYLAEHAKRIYGFVINDQQKGAQLLLDKIKSGTLSNRTTIREIKRRCWQGLSDNEVLYGALEILEDCGVIRAIEEKPHQSGRPTKRILINPKLIGEFVVKDTPKSEDASNQFTGSHLDLVDVTIDQSNDFH